MAYEAFKYGVVTKNLSNDSDKIPIQDNRSIKPYLLRNKDFKDKNGAVVQPMDVYEYKKKGIVNTLEFFAPNVIGFALSIAYESISKAEKLYNSSIDFSKIKHNITNKYTNDIKKIRVTTKSVYDYIQEIQKAAVFSYNAIETFCNLSIPEDYEYKLKKDKKGILEVYDKNAIERWIPLKEKISKVMKEIYSTKNPKSKKWWAQLTELESIRHNIVHPKSIKATETYKEYFDKKIFDLLKVPLTIIEFFEESMINNEKDFDFMPWTDTGIKSNRIRVVDPKDVEVVGNIHQGKTNK